MGLAIWNDRSKSSARRRLLSASAFSAQLTNWIRIIVLMPCYTRPIPFISTATPQIIDWPGKWIMLWVTLHSPLPCTPPLLAWKLEFSTCRSKTDYMAGNNSKEPLVVATLAGTLIQIRVFSQQKLRKPLRLQFLARWWIHLRLVSPADSVKKLCIHKFW